MIDHKDDYIRDSAILAAIEVCLNPEASSSWIQDILDEILESRGFSGTVTIEEVVEEFEALMDMLAEDLISRLPEDLANKYDRD